MISKIIHYCWFGGGEKPELVRKCIASWEKYCPDWEIKEWNESNFDISQGEYSEYMINAYEKKAWAFVVDVVRLIVIYDQGGVYLDTDVELHASMDELLKYKSFFSFENISMLNLGNGFGAEKNCPFLKEMLKSYMGNLTFRASPKINTKSLVSICPDLILNGSETQFVDDNLFLSTIEYGKIARHYEIATWIEEFEHDPNKRKKKSKISEKAFWRKGRENIYFFGV